MLAAAPEHREGLLAPIAGHGRASGGPARGSPHLTSFTDRKNQVTSTTYDGLNRPTLVTYADTSTTAYTWDAGHRLTQIADSISGTITRTYHDLDHLTSETTPQGSVSSTYDAGGRRTGRTVAGPPTSTYASQQP